MGFWGLSHPAMLSMVMAGVKKEKPVGLTTGFVQLGSFDHLSSPSWTRTNNQVINSHLLYQLSYRGLIVVAKGVKVSVLTSLAC